MQMEVVAGGRAAGEAGKFQSFDDRGGGCLCGHVWLDISMGDFLWEERYA